MRSSSTAVCVSQVLQFTTVGYDLLTHFGNLASTKKLPTFDELLAQASVIRERYGSQAAYDQSLDKAKKRQQHPHTDAEIPDLSEIPNDDVGEVQDENEPTARAPRTTESDEVPSKSTADKLEDGPKVHKELPGFDGDRVLSNSILFIMEFGWRIELNYAIPEGDVGRVLEILKSDILPVTGDNLVEDGARARGADSVAYRSGSCSRKPREIHDD
ncbi:hypothetical protein B0H14DRAFT_3619565 [Mycena olivaceomarginata]|nr:hypothetical protein B0H14DRAFT_3619565 [Mycena olivaceomarginata]